MARRKSELQSLVTHMRAHEKEQAAERKRRTSYGVFVWNAANQYRAADAIKIYKTRGPAEKYASPRNLVVRELVA